MASQSEIGRRGFLARMGAAGLMAPALLLRGNRAEAQTFVRPPSQVVVGGKTLLQASDFQYLGAFRLPRFLNGKDIQYVEGLTHRYVNGELRFLAGPPVLYEMVAPALNPYPANAATAQVVRSWGDVAATDSYGKTFGIHWDERDQRLYWANGNEYNTNAPYNPSVGYCLLDDSAGIVRKGIWGFSQRSCKMTMGGITPIPQWFVESYAPGRRLAAGFGGYFSIINTGPVSMGPALTAFDPSALSVPSKSSVGHTPLVGYPFNGAAYTTPDRCHRDPDLVNDFDGWKVRNGIGYWTWTDFLWQAATWVDTPTKTGMMFFPTLSNGRAWYNNSTINTERGSHWWYVYDPADLGAVAKGATQQWAIQPARSWSVHYSGISYPLPAWFATPPQQIVGTTFDGTTQTLYVALKHGLGISPGSGIVVHAYRVA